MCHNSAIMQNNAEHIEKLVQEGLPQKAVKTVAHTLKKRAAMAAAMSRANDNNSTSSSSSASESDNADDFKASSSALEQNVNAIKSNTITTSAKQTTSAEPIILRCPVTSRFIKLSDASASNKRQQPQAANPDNHRPTMSSEVYVDMLALGTQVTKLILERLAQVALKLQRTKIYTLLIHTTQPAHIIAIAVLSFVVFTLWPELISTSRQQHSCSILSAIIYLAAFATHFGAQIWMTFVSGLSLYFSLPRHTFGQCQQILFPRYFTLNATLSIGMLILYIKSFYSGWSTAVGIQLAALTLSAIIEVTVRLYLAPPMLRLMHEKYRIENTIGSGQEVGSLVAGDLMQCPHYQRIHKGFRRIHMTIAIGNMIVLLATCVHLYYLAAKIQIT